MYKVMLVDDDYPVLEFLSDIVEWEALGLHLQSIHENGASALNYALMEMPDILITDIGMPKMNGLELTKKMKERNSNLQVAILSCHNEFEFAQRALTLKVQDYILKETLDPNDLSKLLISYKEKLEEIHSTMQQQVRLKKQLEANNELAKERFFQQIIYQPELNNQNWYEQKNNIGFRLENKKYLPILCTIDNYLFMKEHFFSKNILEFAVHNIISEIMSSNNKGAIHFKFESNRVFILFPMSASIKVDHYDQITKTLEKIQDSMINLLSISVSFLIGEKVVPANFKHELTSLLASETQLFYMGSQSIMIKDNRRDISSDDLFSYYDEAVHEFRKLIFASKIKNVEPIVLEWMNFIRENAFSPSIVKDWVLKILLELTFKLRSLQSFQAHHEIDIMHHEILKIENLVELSDWLITYLESAIVYTMEGLGQTEHQEILKACIYITKNIESKLSLDDVANHVYLNASYLSRLFRQEMGTTFIEYVTSLKIERAKELLDQTTYSLGEICEKLSYDNQSYFIKVFKSHVGKTPNKYRKN